MCNNLQSVQQGNRFIWCIKGKHKWGLWGSKQNMMKKWQRSVIQIQKHEVSGLFLSWKWSWCVDKDIDIYHIPTAIVCPQSAATIRAEHPHWSTALTSAPWARTSWSPATFPEWAAACSGVLHPHKQIHEKTGWSGTFTASEHENTVQFASFYKLWKDMNSNSHTFNAYKKPTKY